MTVIADVPVVQGSAASGPSAAATPGSPTAAGGRAASVQSRTVIADLHVVPGSAASVPSTSVTPVSRTAGRPLAAGRLVLRARSGRRGALRVAEDQPSHRGVQVHRLAAGRDDPGQAVVDAEGGQAGPNAEDPGQI